jgi:hypothetical protein
MPEPADRAPAAPSRYELEQRLLGLRFVQPISKPSTEMGTTDAISPCLSSLWR